MGSLIKHKHIYTPGRFDPRWLLWNLLCVRYCSELAAPIATLAEWQIFKLSSSSSRMPNSFHVSYWLTCSQTCTGWGHLQVDASLAETKTLTLNRKWSPISLIMRVEVICRRHVCTHVPSRFVNLVNVWRLFKTPRALSEKAWISCLSFITQLCDYVICSRNYQIKKATKYRII